MGYDYNRKCCNNFIMMTSCTTPFNKILFAPSGPSSETPSEISSVDSDWSDIRTIAMKLGVTNPDDLLTERFKVDRRKLENMIETQSVTEGLNSAEYFFDNVMKTTSTYISWPCRLKIGAKTKKDPHVRIVGKPEDVALAKERILASLDSRGTRVIMKMDVSYTDHSYIIGRGGNNIKRIMEETSTHIHFPDSNRSNPTEKSNQVSLCGSLEGVERARSLVRSSTPLLISFELPIMAPGRPVPDHDTPYIKEVEVKYNVQVIFSTRPKLHSSLVLVKGSEKEAVRVQEATQLLINFTCESIAIIFPDVNDMNIKPIKKSQVTITGKIDGVYKARQQLIGNLPIALIFDYPDSQGDTSDIVNLSQKYGVFISLRQKQRQSTMAVVVKGVEKFIDKIYEARHEILKLSTTLIKPEIPTTYFSPKDQELETAFRRNLTSLLSNYPDSPLTPSFPLTPSNYASPYNNNNNTSPYHKNQGSPNGVCAPKYIQQQNFHSAQQINNNNYLTVQPQLPIRQSLSPRNSIGNTSGYHSFSSSTNSLEQLYPPCNNNSNSTNNNGGNNNNNNNSNNNSTPAPSRGHYSPDSAYSSDSKTRRMSDSGMHNMAGACGNSEYRPPPHFDITLQPRAFDFDMKRVIGMKAIERQPQGEVRTPNSNWVGLGLSATSPVPIETVDDTAWNLGYGHISPYNLGATTGLVDSTSTNRRNHLSQQKNIPSVLTSLGLEHYIKTFVLNEIDLDMFTSLTEENLVELGITAFGARKKLLVAIHSLLAESIGNCTASGASSPRFSGSAAPGAERRASSRW